ncbi:thioesterase [Streptomyces albus]|uniref:Thioesterase n=2 Tax=Streptomyces albus subsp. albus TaxID=67257 RepID=H6D579_STRA4|nr:putative thioesterase [Streptomyces albus]AJE80646.1 thioesterase [Streptomyces albus]AOU74957.1 thioesterase [Streptomyces albus]AYN30766.1 thioesterase [Streptomyces albus]CCD31900.1 thioesterase [Streptomyces albus subsp. albus]
MSTQRTQGSQDADDELWVRRFHPAPEKPVRLVCLPHAGGSASFFFPFSAALAPHADVLAIQYPGRQDRRGEPLLGTVQELTDAVLEALRPWHDRPLVFFGHSMGAVLSFELARRFEREGAPVQGLIASGRRAPTVHREENVHQRGDDALIAEIRALSGTDTGLLADEELLRMVLPAIRSDYKAIETYRYRPDGTQPPLTSPVSVLTGESDPRVSIPEAQAWQELSSGKFTFRSFPGGHFYLTPRQAEVTRAVAEDLAAFARVPAN